MELPKTFFNHDAQAGGFYPKSHVGIDISGFGQRQNVLIEGIRGTGKTHVLKMITRYHLNNFEEIRVLPIYVSLAQLTEHSKKDPDEFRLHLYAHIVQRCVETVEINRTNLQPDRNLLEKAILYTARLFGIKNEPDIEELLAYIKQTVELLLFALQFDLTSENFKQSDSRTVAKSIKGGANLSFDTTGLKAGVTIGSEDAISIASGFDASMNYVGSRLVHHNAASFLIEFLKQLQIILNLDYSLILLDECSEASVQAQVEVFRLFKMIRGASPQARGQDTCAYFIGTVYPRSETYYPTRSKDGFSFEPGQDCTIEFLQWDETDLDTYVSFFRDMTLNRAREVIDYPGDFESFRKTIFDTDEAFLLAAYGAHGIPRRFWEIMKQAYDSNVGRILSNRVSIAIQNITNDQILAHESLEDDDVEFIYSLSGILTKNNLEIRIENRAKDKDVPQSIYFSINRKVVTVLNRLVMQGAIHDKSRMRTTLRPSRPQPIYAMDLAVIHTFRVVPHEQFVKVATHDLPKCPINDFKEAPAIYGWLIEFVYKTHRLPPLEAKIDDETSRNKGRIGKSSTGIVKLYTRGEGGFIGVDDSDLDAMFLVNDIETQHRDKLKVGDKVRFISHLTNDGKRVAREIVILGMKKRAEGTIKLYKPDKYGFIEVMDGGPDAFFIPKRLEKNIRTKLAAGDRVEFILQETPKGRQAFNIKLVTGKTKFETGQMNELSNYIKAYVKTQPSPVKLGELVQIVTNNFGDNVLNTRWFGFGSFKKLLQQLDLGNLSISAVAPGYVYDPTIHKLPTPMQAKKESSNQKPQPGPTLVKQYPDLARLGQRIRKCIQVPHIAPSYYAILLQEMANEINENGSHSEATKAIHGRCSKRGVRIGKSPIRLVLTTVEHTIHPFDKGTVNAETLGEVFIAAIIDSCSKAHLQLSDEDVAQLREWIIGAIPKSQEKNTG